jgi:hypothetical protein
MNRDKLNEPNALGRAASPAVAASGHSGVTCVCGHGESMHFAISGACQKIITRDPRLENHLRCTCRSFRPERSLR